MGKIKWIFGSKKRLIVSVLLLLLIAFLGYKNLASKSQAPKYQTAQVQRGTLVESVSASGNISSGSSVSITTQATGVVNQVFVKNGDSVSQGQNIANVTLDQVSQQKQDAALATLQSARNSLDSANANLNTLQNTEFVANQKLINDAVARGLATNDPVYIEEQAAWLAAEAGYKNQQAVISQAQTSVASAALAYQQISSTITAPISGVINGLTIAPGSPIAAQSSTTSNPSQAIGAVTQDGPLQALVNISEVDSVNVDIGQKATLTLDAFPGKTFTGHVVSINTNGVVSSGVVTYPATISFDSKVDHVYPNMAVSAQIITKIKENVLLVPSGVVQNASTQPTIRVMQNGQVQAVDVSVGDSNDTQTEITSGLSEGDTVVTSVAAPSSGGSSSSPFGGTRGGFGVFGGGGGRGVVVGGRGG